ncbi:MAG: YlmH/Sll1252 family protein [Blautia sp.]|nr:YlmH/Sll1252 family protein [Blautia sp.]MCM1201510.1 YlmH/Sll1252 family protein [Bacteroides fragilis]
MTEAADKEILRLKNRLKELADKSCNRGIYTYTPFLSLSQQQVFHELKKELSYAGYGAEGGAPACERKMIRFGSPEALGYDEEYPIAAIEMRPVMPRFADTLTHRDFLGALMNLGIERSTLGDIFVQEQYGVLFCQQSIVPYLLENLRQVKHTGMNCRIVEGGIALQSAEPEKITVTVSSARIDSVIAKIYHISRSQSLTLFGAGRIFVNGIMIENNGYQLKKEDAVTVRGYGKFLYYGQAGETKKGKEKVSVGVFGQGRRGKPVS